jgi:NAD-dependent DNA ligase
MADVTLDEHGQPLELGFNLLRLMDRHRDELNGICRGLLFDGVVTKEEIYHLRDWLVRTSGVASTFPGDILFKRIERVLADGTIEEEERVELEEFIKKLVGGDPIQGGENAISGSTQVAYDEPQPEVSFDSRVFCLTGKFIFGIRRSCREAIMTLGGTCVDSPTLSTDYLVIGNIGSRDWMHTSYGRKIERAIEIRNNREGPVAILSEEHWVASMQRML